MSLELTFLGTGTSSGVPIIGCACDVCTSKDSRDARTRPSIMISYPQVGEDLVRRLIVDTGPDFRTQMIRHRVGRVDGVFLTHAHADHIFGLDDLRCFNTVMKEPIQLYAEASTMEHVQQIFSYIFQKHRNVNQTFVADLVPNLLNEAEPLTLFGAVWTPLRLMHGSLPILGFRVDYADSKGHPFSLAYCTDVSLISPQTYPLLLDLDVLVIDGLRYQPHPTHLTIDEALVEIERIGPKRAYLTHMAHEISHRTLVEQLPCHVKPAYDGLTVQCAVGCDDMGGEDVLCSTYISND